MRESAETARCRIMQPAEFRAYHEPALELQEVKHGFILNALARIGGEKFEEVLYWTLGEPGECAIQLGRVSILLIGELAKNQCQMLAELSASKQYPGVIGPDVTAKWFTGRARELGLQFLKPEALQLYSINDKPRYPGTSGRARPVTSGDATLLADWLTAFHRETLPHYPVPAREELERAASEDRFLFWIDRRGPVSMAGIARRLKISAAIRAVYTPPETARSRIRRFCYRRNGRADLRRGAQNGLPLCGCEQPGLEPLLYEDWLHSSLQIDAPPQNSLVPLLGCRNRDHPGQPRFGTLRGRRAGPFTNLGTAGPTDLRRRHRRGRYVGLARTGLSDSRSAAKHKNGRRAAIRVRPLLPSRIANTMSSGVAPNPSALATSSIM